MAAPADALYASEWANDNADDDFNEDAVLFGDDEDEDEDEEVLGEMLDRHAEEDAEAAVVAAVAAALGNSEDADGELLDVFLDEYFPANFVEEPYPEESGLGPLDVLSPTIPEELEFVGEEQQDVKAEQPVQQPRKALLEAAEIVEEEEENAGQPMSPQARTVDEDEEDGEEEEELETEHARNENSDPNNAPASNIHHRQSKPKLDAAAKQRALLAEIAKKKQMAQQMLAKQERLKAMHREKLKRMILENAANARSSTFQATTEAAERSKIKRSESKVLSAEEQQKLQEENYKQVAALRRKFKEQHKRLLASLIQQKQEQQQKDVQLKAAEEDRKERVRKAAEKQRRASLDHRGEERQSSLESLTVSDTGSSRSKTELQKSPSPSSLAVGSGVHAVRARTAGDVADGRVADNGNGDADGDTTAANVLGPAPLVRDSTSAGVAEGILSAKDKAAHQASMKQRRQKLQQYLKQIKDTCKEKELAAEKDKLRMTKRMELLQQRVLSKSAGNLLANATQQQKQQLRQQQPHNVDASSDNEDDDEQDDDDNEQDESDAEANVAATSHPRKVVSSFVARHLANQARMSEPRDFAAWKKQHGVPPDGKVFAMTGWYPCVKQCLLDRGWHFNPDRESVHFDLKWTIKSHELKQDQLQPWQLTNHFLRNTVLTTKAGLLRSLRNLSWIANVSSDHIHPRAYDLNNPAELHDFVTDYRCLKAESILKAVYCDLTGRDEPAREAQTRSSSHEPTDSSPRNSPVSDSGGAGDDETNVACPAPIIPLETYMVNQVVLTAACNLCRRQQRYLEDGFLDEPYDGVEPLLTDLEWEVLSTCSVCSTGTLPDKPAKPIELDSAAEDGDAHVKKKEYRKHWNKYWKARQAVSEDLNKLTPMTEEQLQEIHKLLVGLRKLNPQFALNGLGKKCSNLWVAKPAAKSRGQGIRTFRNLDELLQYIGLSERSAGTPSQWIVQKYIENPLIIANRKFDLRQWVLVTSWNPLTVYFYHTCYLRFGVEPYSTTDDDLGNQYVHLVNNSIGKHSSNFDRVIVEEVTGREIRGFMLTSADFAEYLRLSTGQDLFHMRIQPQMKQIAQWASMCAVDGVEHRKNSWELFGYDFMIDNQCRPWLIEVNSSPACDYSTEVTKDYVQAALQDIIKVVLDRREWEALPKKDRGAEPDAGGWELVYKGPYLETPIAAFGAEMSLRGSGIDLPKPVRPAPPVPTFKRRNGSFKAAQSAASPEESQVAPPAPVAASTNSSTSNEIVPAPHQHQQQQQTVAARPVKPAMLQLETNPSQRPKSPQSQPIRAPIPSTRDEPDASPRPPVSAAALAVSESGTSSPLDGMVLMGKSMSITAKQN